MKIQTIKMTGFKNYDVIHFYQLSDRVNIIGENYQGKTSFAEAVSVALYGVTLSGSPFTDHLIRHGDKQYDITVEVEIDGVSHEVTRIKGAKKSEVWLDGRKASQTDLDKLLPSKDVFLSVWLPGYFTAMPEKDARELLMSLIKQPKQEEVVARMGAAEQKVLQYEQLRDPDSLAKEKRGEIKSAEVEINRLEGRIEGLKERLERVIPEAIRFDGTELSQLREQFSVLKSGPSAEIQRLKNEASQLGHKYQSFKVQLQQVPALAIDDSCPTCGQALLESAIERTKNEHAARVSEIEQKNEYLMGEMKQLVEQGNAIKQRIQTLETEPVDTTDTNDIQCRIKELEAQQAEAKANEGYCNRLRIEMAEDRDALTKAEETIADLRKEQDTLAASIQALSIYRAELSKMLVEQLSEHLNRVSIQLFDLVKSTGEMKPVFHVLYDGKPVKSLSRSEQMRANLEFCTLFNRLCGCDAPVFLDNAESCTHFVVPEATQIFTASVVKGAELTVTCEPTEEGRVAS